MEPVSIALAIAKATGLDDFILDKIRGNKTANTVLNLAKQATGLSDPKACLEAISQNEQHALELKTLIYQHKHELSLAYYEDRADARAMYRIHPQQADKLAERIMRYNLPYIVFLLIVNCLAIYFLKEHAALLAAISNVLGMAIKSLFDERKEVSGFYFGSSMGTSPDNGKNDYE